MTDHDMPNMNGSTLLFHLIDTFGPDIIERVICTSSDGKNKATYENVLVEKKIEKEKLIFLKKPFKLEDIEPKVKTIAEKFKDQPLKLPHDFVVIDTKSKEEQTEAQPIVALEKGIQLVTLSSNPSGYFSTSTSTSTPSSTSSVDKFFSTENQTDQTPIDSSELLGGNSLVKSPSREFS